MVITTPLYGDSQTRDQWPSLRDHVFLNMIIIRDVVLSGRCMIPIVTTPCLEIYTDTILHPARNNTQRGSGSTEVKRQHRGHMGTPEVRWQNRGHRGTPEVRRQNRDHREHQRSHVREQKRGHRGTPEVKRQNRGHILKVRWGHTNRSHGAMTKYARLHYVTF